MSHICVACSIEPLRRTLTRGNQNRTLTVKTCASSWRVTAPGAKEVHHAGWELASGRVSWLFPLCPRGGDRQLASIQTAPTQSTETSPLLRGSAELRPRRGLFRLCAKRADAERLCDAGD